MLLDFLLYNISNMYPYGKSYGTNAIYNAADDYRYGFNGMEKEKNMDASGDITDFGARVFDANFPMFLSRDPLQKNYPNLSPYVFGANNPIAAIDPDGRVVVFINGLHGGNWGEEYWEGFDSEIMKFWKDENVEYYDGSVGGKSALVPSLNIKVDFSIMGDLKSWAYGNNTSQNNFEFEFNYIPSSISAEYRYNQGYAQAKADAGRIYGNLDENETIKIVTHSMGYAWGSGYQQGLIDYAVIELENPQLVDKISIVLNFAPFQAGSYSANKLLSKKTHHKISILDPLMYPSWSPENSNDITSFIERLISSHPISRFTLKEVPAIDDNNSGKGTSSSSKSSKSGKGLDNPLSPASK